MEENLKTTEVQERFIGFKGFIEMALRNALTGEQVGEKQTFNTVVTAGRAWILAAIQSANAASSQVLQQMAFGTDTTAPATSNTALGGESVRLAVASWDNTNLTSTTPSWKAIVTLATNQGNTTLAELGLFNSSSGGTMLNRATFGTIDKTTSNTLEVTLTVSG